MNKGAGEDADGGAMEDGRRQRGGRQGRGSLACPSIAANSFSYFPRPMLDSQA